MEAGKLFMLLIKFPMKVMDDKVREKKLSALSKIPIRKLTKGKVIIILTSILNAAKITNSTCTS